MPLQWMQSSMWRPLMKVEKGHAHFTFHMWGRYFHQSADCRAAVGQTCTCYIWMSSCHVKRNQSNNSRRPVIPRPLISKHSMSLISYTIITLRNYMAFGDSLYLCAACRSYHVQFIGILFSVISSENNAMK